MTAETLRFELLAVPGVVVAEVGAGGGDGPAEIKVRLAPEADADRVGVEVQRVLAAHGMRSRFPSAEEDLESDQTPLEPAPIRVPPPSPPQLSVTDPVPDIPASPVVVAAVSVEERTDGVTVTVRLSDGRIAAAEVALDAASPDGAIVAAVTGAAGETAAMLAVDWTEVEGARVVTVVMRRRGETAAGAAVVNVGRAFAVAAATAAALAPSPHPSKSPMPGH